MSMREMNKMDGKNKENEVHINLFPMNVSQTNEQWKDLKFLQNQTSIEDLAASSKMMCQSDDNNQQKKSPVLSFISSESDPERMDKDENSLLEHELSVSSTSSDSSETPLLLKDVFRRNDETEPGKASTYSNLKHFEHRKPSIRSLCKSRG